MALLKSIENPSRNGSQAEYWRIGEIRVNFRSEVCEIILHGYRDKEFAGEVRNNPAIDIPLNITGDDFRTLLKIADGSGGGLRRAIYKHVRTLELFATSDDD
jgi:hypothetical protein